MSTPIAADDGIEVENLSLSEDENDYDGGRKSRGLAVHEEEGGAHGVLSGKTALSASPGPGACSSTNSSARSGCPPLSATAAVAASTAAKYRSSSGHGGQGHRASHGANQGPGLTPAPNRPNAQNAASAPAARWHPSFSSVKDKHGNDMMSSSTTAARAHGAAGGTGSRYNAASRDADTAGSGGKKRSSTRRGGVLESALHQLRKKIHGDSSRLVS